MESWELEQISRSLAMLPEGHSAGAPTNDAASSLIEEITRMGRDNGRYQQAVAELRRIVAVLDAE